MLKNNKHIPEKTGIYLFKSKNNILYIGKAKNLKKRIGQYFQKNDNSMINDLLNQSADIEVIITDDEKDALHLEYNLIQNYQPPFNIRLKDDKSFPYIEITTGDKIPGIYYSRNINSKNFYVGPISDARKTKVIIDIVTRIFKIRTCSDNTFKKSSECLYFHIERCSAPCAEKISESEYIKNVKDAVQFLRGNREKILRKLEKRMGRLANELRFEEAQKVKEDIALIGQFELESYISSGVKTDYDVISVHRIKNDVFVILFSVLQGKVKKREFFSFNTISSAKEDILKDFCLSFYKKDNLPDEIIVGFIPSDRTYIEDTFSKIKGKKVGIKIPQRGNKKRMLELVLKNLDLYVQKSRYKTIGKRIKRLLKLNNFPLEIEGFDVSHFSERERVGSVVVFSNGKAMKKEYRNYLIKRASEGDTDALKEILERRYVKDERSPDLILIDGGKAQLNAAKKIKEKLGLMADIVSIAKREERIYLEKGGSIIFDEGSPEKFLFQNIRNEAHRRAITHHRKRRETI